MRRERNLFAKVITFDNLRRAFIGASRGKRDRPEVRRFAYHLELELWRIRRELEAGAYEWGAYRRFWITDPKRREIRAAPFRDRVVHHALYNVIDPVLRRGFIADSYACLPGRGVHGAVRRYESFVRARQGQGYVLKCDIEMDDFLFLAADREQARGYLMVVRAFLAQCLRLELNPRRVVVAPLEQPCDLLGYVLHADGRRRVRRRSVRRLWRRLPVLADRVATGRMANAEARSSLASWFGLAKHADAFRLSGSIFRQRDVRNMAKRILVRQLSGA